ncbi:recombination factor protein RarA, partial [Pseudomonas aeruginosa]
GSLPVPLHLRNAPTKLMQQMGYHEGYRYAHDEPNGYAAGQSYFPEGVARPGWYQPTDRGVERRLGERLTWLRSLDDGTLPEADA